MDPQFAVGQRVRTVAGQSGSIVKISHDPRTGDLMYQVHSEAESLVIECKETEIMPLGTEEK